MRDDDDEVLLPDVTNDDFNGSPVEVAEYFRLDEDAATDDDLESFRLLVDVLEKLKIKLKIKISSTIITTHPKSFMFQM